MIRRLVMVLIVLATVVVLLPVFGAGAQQPAQPAAGTAPLAPIDFGDEDIRDIREPLPVEPPWWSALLPWAVGAGAVLLFGLAGFALAKRLRRGPDAATLANRRLDAARAAIDDGDANRFADLASEAVRQYVEQRYGVLAPKRTTDELLADLAADAGSPLAPHRGLLADFLAACDAAKFAGFALAREQMEAMDTAARRFVAVGESEARGAA